MFGGLKRNVLGVVVVLFFHSPFIIYPISSFNTSSGCIIVKMLNNIKQTASHLFHHNGRGRFTRTALAFTLPRPFSEGAWRCTGGSNAELIENLKASYILEHEDCVQAMKRTDRGLYSPRLPYQDSPQQIGYDATISAPHMHAHALEYLYPVLKGKKDAKVLDVGCGSGYLTAVFARLVGEEGRAYGIDYLDGLVQMTESNIRKDDPNLLDSGRIKLAVGNGWKGWKEEGPFDAIHVGAAAELIPDRLVEDLKVGGRMIIPVGPEGYAQRLLQVDKVSDEKPAVEGKTYHVKVLLGVVYVPLVNRGNAPATQN